ncbi:MAG: NFACT family protein [Parachlamydiales bacterium]|jgi:predicted ribosome quality control (RQC) complex YloA/Tae2 family protein
MKLSWENAVSTTLRQLHKNLKRTTSTMDTTRQDLQLAEGWENNYHEAVLLQSNLYSYKKGDTQISVDDWKDGTTKTLAIEPRIPVEEQLKKRFKAAKKLQKSIPHFERRLKMLQSKALIVEEEIGLLEKISCEEEWEQIKHRFPSLSPQSKPGQKKIPAPKLPYKKYQAKDGTEIWVGRTARDNETLSLKLARGNDWWLHTADVPGSHIVIRSEAPAQETLYDAMQLALQHSRLAKAGEGEVILTQAKFVSRGPGGHRPGTVSVSKHKKCRVVADPAQLERLKKSILLP